MTPAIITDLGATAPAHPAAEAAAARRVQCVRDVHMHRVSTRMCVFRR